jgi:hypothetical protein
METSTIIIIVILAIVLYFIYNNYTKTTFKNKDRIKSDKDSQGSTITDDIGGKMGTEDISPDYYSDKKTIVARDANCNIIPESLFSKDAEGNLIIPPEYEGSNARCTQTKNNFVGGRMSYDSILNRTNVMINNKNKTAKKTVKFLDQ